jgi:2-keto-4-pentenoate hydratase
VTVWLRPAHHDGEVAAIPEVFDPVSLADEIVRARARRTPLPAFTRRGGLDLEQAYEVQREVVSRRLARGERQVGWKLGYTTEVMRQQMGIESPNFGPLTDAMALDDGSTIPADVIQPLVEPEVALVIGEVDAVASGLDAGLRSVSSAFACLEVVDPVWEGLDFRIEDNTADGSSAAYFVLGPELDIDRLGVVEVSFSCGDASERGDSSAVEGGHPAGSLIWLARELDRRGGALRSGQVILTGGLTRALPIGTGQSARAEFRVTGQDPCTVIVHRGLDG